MVRSTPLPTPPVPSDLRRDKSPSFKASKVKDYCRIPCLRYARIMAAADKPGHFCFRYSEPGKPSLRCAHCVLGGYDCDHRALQIEDEGAIGFKLSAACLKWLQDVDAGKPASPRPEAVDIAAREFKWIDDEHKASWLRDAGRVPQNCTRNFNRPPARPRVCSLGPGSEFADAGREAAAADDDDSDSPVSSPKMRDDEDDFVLGPMEL